MFKRVTIVALVVAAFVLMVAVPALAFNGYRGDYTTAAACATCHSGIAGIPTVYPDWADTKHAVAGADDQALRLPYGSVCQGCHTSNFDPTKVVPTPVATAADGTVSWEAANGMPTQPQAVGSAASSENYVGCSSCHYGANVTGGLAQDGVDTNDTAHVAPYGEMANADICGACHSRYSYTTDTFAVTAIPAPRPTTLIQPQMAIGYPMLGSPATTGWDPAAPLADYLIVPQPGWTPTPDPRATSAAGLMTYWQVNGEDTMWQAKGHDGSAAQYPEWASEGHANALTGLTSQSFWGFLDEATKQECLECHSADFRILEEAGKNPTSTDAKYGITCVGCHTPHDAGTVTGAWDEEFDAQLRGDANLNGNGSNLCVECHNGEIPVGTTASPGAEVHHPMREMMDGYGAIDVPSFPSVHKGKCIECHMAPTSISRGSVQLGGNHTFTIIEPEVAAEASADLGGSAGVVDGMPFSACTTCHSRTSVNGYGETVVDSAALWLQDTITQRQEWTHAKIAEIHTELNAGAVRLGYADETAAYEALVAIPEADRTFGQTNFLKAWTNVQYVESEGSFGLHNWDYSREIVNVALLQARTVQVVQPEPRNWVISLRVSKNSITQGQQVFFRGAVQTGWGTTASGKVTLQRRMIGQSWRNWKSQTLASNGAYKIVQRLNFKKGKWKFRAKMPGDGGLNLTTYSRISVITIK